MRTAHYWKKGRSNRLPSSFLFLDTETKPINERYRDVFELHKLFIGVARYVRLENGELRQSKYMGFESINEFHLILNDCISRTRPLWVVAHNLAFDFTIVNGWKLMFDKGCEVEKFIFEDGVFFGKINHKFGKIVLCDSFNYFKCSLEKMGESMGSEKLTMPTDYNDKTQWYDYCVRDVEVLSESFLSLVKFNHVNCLGKFSPTIASLSFNAFKTRFMKHDVLVHDNRNALVLERQGYYGGIVDTNFIGKCPADKVYELDINSMYPYQCTKPLPYQFVGYKEMPSIQCVKDLMQNYMVCCELWVNTKHNTYPFRTGKKVVYPIGHYQTILMQPELEKAISNNDVKVITKVAWYHADTIFKDYMDFFSKKKNEYETSNNEAFRTICKYYMNTLYGKTAQRSERWLPITKNTIEEIGEKLGINYHKIEYLIGLNLLPDRLHDTLLIPSLHLALKLRNLYGIEEVYVGSGESRDSCPIIAATITSYARVLLRQLQTIAGKRNWFYSDTDSIWVNSKGYENLMTHGYINDQKLGYLSLKKIHDVLIVHGKKDYETNIVTKRKGVRLKAKPEGPNSFSQWHFPSAKTILKTRQFDSITIRRIIKTLRRNVDWCHVLSSGYTKPLSYPEDFGNGK